MKHLLAVLVMLAGFTSVCWASDETLAHGIPGTYTRASGMYSESVLLKADKSYLFTFRFDIGSDEEKGTWTVRDSVLILSPKMRGEVRKTWPSQFRILAMCHELALSVIEVASESQPEDSPTRLFLPDKKKSNQPPEPMRVKGLHGSFQSFASGRGVCR